MASTTRVLSRHGHALRSLQHTRPFHWLARTGFAARGITYGVIGGLAMAMAVGAGTDGTTADQQGALTLIARSPPGRAALVVICASLLGYALWKLAQAAWGRGPEGGGSTQLKDRAANLTCGLVYLVFFAVAVRILVAGAADASDSPSHAAAGVLGWPGGSLIVGAPGVVLMAVSLYQLHDAIRGGFARDSKMAEMIESHRHVFMVAGRIGLGARAVVFGLVGYFLLRTALVYSPGQAVGVNGALARLQQQPLGPWLLGVVAVGLLTFAGFSLLEARYRRL